MRIINEIERFETLVQKVGQQTSLTIRKRAEAAYEIVPSNFSKGPKKVALTIMAITHGNEVAGAVILNEVLEAIAAGSIQIKQPIALILGNPSAASEGLRYLERDLNRSFNRPNADDRESRRAMELAEILDETHLLLDIHQTKEPAESPFFIFPYSKSGLALARSISRDIPIVTHWGKPFSQEGMCTDEYTNTKGGCGITLEVGQNGFHPFRVGTGVQAALTVLRVSQHCWEKSAFPSWNPTDPDSELNAFGFLQIIPYPEQGKVHLKDGLNNFTPIEKGQILGSIDGRDIVAEDKGLVLFPQYMRHGEKKRPAELLRVLRPLHYSELPEVAK